MEQFTEDMSIRIKNRASQLKLFQSKCSIQYLFLKQALSDQPRMVEFIKREIGILQTIESQNIVKLIDVARTANSIYMFLEYCNDGDLNNYMSKKKDKRLSEVFYINFIVLQLETVIFLKHIVQGFKVLYSSKIIHRDIKPENILLHDGIAKISDFGFARVIETGMNGLKLFNY